MWIWIATILCVILGLIYLWFKISFNHFENRGIRGPKPTFPYGNQPNSLFMQKSFIHDYEKIYKEFKGKAAFVGAFGFKSPELIALDPEIVKIVMVKNFKNFHDNQFGKMVKYL
jgi:cytochrome P450 family 28